MKKYIFLLAALITFNLSFSQNVSISSDTTFSADESAILDLDASDKGFLTTRIVLDDATTAFPVLSPAKGLFVFNNGGAENEGFWYWDGSKWRRLISADEHGITDAQLIHGEMYIENPATYEVLPMAVTPNYYGLTSASEGYTTGSEYVRYEDNATADRLVIGSQGAGTYLVTLSSSFGGNGNVKVGAAIHINGVLQNGLAFLNKLNSTGDVSSASLTGIVTLQAGDYLDVRFNSDTDNKNVYIYLLNLHISRITP